MTPQVSYGYFEKDDIQMENFAFFIRAGMQPSPTGQRIVYSLVSSTDTCTPCKHLIDNPM